MTRDEAKKLLPIIQAYADGAEIEARAEPKFTWVRFTDVMTFYADIEYRIKPKAREFWLSLCFYDDDGKAIYTGYDDLSKLHQWRDRHLVKTEIMHVREVLPEDEK